MQHNSPELQRLFRPGTRWHKRCTGALPAARPQGSAVAPLQQPLEEAVHRPQQEERQSLQHFPRHTIFADGLSRRTLADGFVESIK